MSYDYLTVHVKNYIEWLKENEKKLTSGYYSEPLKDTNTLEIIQKLNLLNLNLQIQLINLSKQLANESLSHRFLNLGNKTLMFLKKWLSDGTIEKFKNLSNLKLYHDNYMLDMFEFKNPILSYDKNENIVFMFSITDYGLNMQIS